MSQVEIRSPLSKINPLHNEHGPSDSNPGPGSYNPDDKFVREQSPKYRIGGNTERLNVVSNDMKSQPGPGHYNR